MTDSQAPKHENRLAQETSPYLLQHKNNPVDWYPWGTEALRRAADEDKPILLSIGYAACHWCHVMERESFENEAIANLMNQFFVCIKVDREERPDLDDIYMSATVAMSGSGGWPMTVFLTPEQTPFFAGTYFPPEDKWGRPGFATLLQRIAKLWHEERQGIEQQGQALREEIQRSSALSAPAAISRSSVSQAVRALGMSFDPKYGGFGPAPKFPPSAALHLLLRHHQTTGDPRVLSMVTTTLDGMKNGGMYDHIGGGFARYSTDGEWLVPHFEKMLYDNAQLARVYLEAWQVTGHADYERVARETLDWVAREMQDADGGYYSATDADSEGVEGKFFVFSKKEIDSLLQPEAARAFCAYYDITEDGNWEGHNIVHTPRPLSVVAKELDLGETALSEFLNEARKDVYAARERRIHPLLDDKILVSWNGLMLGTMAEAGRILQEPRYVESARRAAEYLWTTLRSSSGRLLRTARSGRAHLDAYLEDYAYLCDGLVDLYEAGGELVWLRRAEELATTLIDEFSDPEGGAFFHTAGDHERLIVRMRNGHDGALPNPNAVAARALIRLGRHLDNARFGDLARAALQAYGAQIEAAPRAFATSLCATLMLLEPALEVVLAGQQDSAELDKMKAALARTFLPNRVLATVTNSEQGETALTSGKTGGDGARAYLCRAYQCQAPVDSAQALVSQLEELRVDLAGERQDELAAKRLEGRASAQGTGAYRDQSPRSNKAWAYQELGSTGWWVSRVGFGGYRVSDRSDEHRQALKKALLGGVNLIDTSSNYTDGHSERLVGKVLEELVDAKQLARDQVVVVSKLGYAQGTALEEAQAQDKLGRGFPEMLKLRPDLWHCIHPDWLEKQLDLSLSRLGLESLDVCLLHNPEYFFKAGDSEPMSKQRDEFYGRVQRAFEYLEQEVARGRIGVYGVSSNTLGQPETLPDTTEFDRLVEAARRTAGDDHHFGVVQLPLNLRETAPVSTVLSLAQRSGIAVLTNRPLNVIESDRLLRLTEPPLVASSGSVEGYAESVEELEREFRSTIASALEARPGSIQPDDLFQNAARLTEHAARKPSYEAWLDFETTGFAPAVANTFRALDSALQGSLGVQWQAWRSRYVEALDHLLDACRAQAAQRSRQRTSVLVEVLDQALPEHARKWSLAHKATASIASLEGVNSVLVGMRSNNYVDTALAVLDQGTVGDAARVLEATKKAQIPLG